MDQDREKRLMDLFEGAWTRMIKNPQTRFSNLNLKEQDQLRGMFLDLFMGHAQMQGVTAPVPSDEVASLKKQVSEGFQEIQQMLGNLSVGSTSVGILQGSKELCSVEDATVLLSSFFDKRNMVTNIGSVPLKGEDVKDVEDVVDSIERLRRLRDGEMGTG